MDVVIGGVSRRGAKMVDGRHSLTQDRNSRSVIGGHIMVATVAVVLG